MFFTNYFIISYHKTQQNKMKLYIIQTFRSRTKKQTLLVLLASLQTTFCTKFFQNYPFFAKNNFLRTGAIFVG